MQRSVVHVSVGVSLPWQGREVLTGRLSKGNLQRKPETLCPCI